MDRQEPLSHRDLLIVISVAFASFMAGLNSYIVNISLPIIASRFNTGTGDASAVILAYLLVNTSSLFLFGRLGDRLGLKRVFIAGYAFFTAGCLLCGLSSSINMLVGFRLIQGVGGGMLQASSYAVVARFLPGDRTGRAYGITLTSYAIGIATGAPVGGFITGYLSWHWIFFVNVPFGIVAMVLARSIPGTIDRGDRQGKESVGFDVPGALLSFFGLAALLYGCNLGKTAGWTSRPILISFGLAFVLLALFILREGKCASPLVDLTFLKERPLAYALLTSLTGFVLVGGSGFLLPFYLQIVRHLTVQQTGLMLLMYSLVQILFTSYAGRLSDRISPHMLCSAGLASAFFCALFFSSSLAFASLVPSFILLIWLPLSYSFFIAPNANHVMRLASSGRHGTASGLLSTSTNLGMMFGVVIFDTAFSQSFPRALPKSVSLFGDALPIEVLLRGFSHAYMAGGVVCLVACLLSFAGREGER
ncbi:MAG: MFS transporter [Syntrophorhabdales bacterium]|jgi:EmrB/QacA subfamily drug resistance transporter